MTMPSRPFIGTASPILQAGRADAPQDQLRFRVRPPGSRSLLLDEGTSPAGGGIFLTETYADLSFAGQDEVRSLLRLHHALNPIVVPARDDRRVRVLPLRDVVTGQGHGVLFLGQLDLEVEVPAIAK